MDCGFRALVGPSFGEIFYGNCLQNGILCVTLPEAVVHDLWAQLETHPGVDITIDLPAQRLIAPDGARHPFDLNPLRKERLIQGIDDIDVTLCHRAAIQSFEAARRQRSTWLPVMSASEIGG